MDRGRQIRPRRPVASSTSKQDHMMLITPSRLAYRGLFGTPGARNFGAWVFYVAVKAAFEVSVDGGPARRERFIAVPPYTPHRVSTTDREMNEVLVEAETVDDALLREHWLASDAQRDALAERIRAGFVPGAEQAADFDLRFFGAPLPTRRLDTRVLRAIERMKDDPAGRLTAEDCAALTGLSFSRFTHLFSEQTRTTFRRFRAWKRARGLMPLIGNGLNLLDVALDAGYADSTHFSHSVRQFYGYTPRDIFHGSRRVAVISQA